MLSNSPFGFDLIKKYTILFGSIFDDIYINRQDQNGATTETIKVPISYSAKDKFLSIVDSDPNIDRPYSELLPRLAFNMVGMRYESNRKLPTNNKLRNPNPTNPAQIFSQYNNVPYEFSFELYVGAKNLTDAYAIIEQALFFFTPDYTASVVLIPEMSNETQDIPIVFNGVSQEDSYDGQFKNRRVIIFTLKFSLKAYIAGPITKPTLIKFIQINYRDPEEQGKTIEEGVGNTPILEQQDIQVTLTANGQPTSNVADSIPYQQINITDNYGIVDPITTFIGNKVFTTVPKSRTYINQIQLDFRKLRNDQYAPIVSWL